MKNAKHDPKLATIQCCATTEDFCISHFITLKGRATLKQCVAKMNAQGWMYFVVLVVLFVSSNGKTQTLIVKGNSNAVNLDHNKRIETALTQIKEKLESLDEKMTSLVSSSSSRSKLLRDFSLSLSLFFSISQSTTYRYINIYILFMFRFN